MPAKILPGIKMEQILITKKNHFFLPTLFSIWCCRNIPLSRYLLVNQFDLHDCLHDWKLRRSYD